MTVLKTNLNVNHMKGYPLYAHLLQLILPRLLQRHKPPHQIVHEYHWHPHIRLDGAHIRVPRWQPVLCTLVGGSEEGVEGVLGRAVAPDRVAV